MITKKFQPTLVAGLLIAIGGCTNTKPPVEMLAETEAEIGKAKDLGAQEHAPVELLDAEDKLSRAKTAMEGKEFAKAEDILEEAMVDAEFASIKSRSVKAKSAASTVNEDIEVLRQELEQQESVDPEYSQGPGEYSGEGDY